MSKNIWVGKKGLRYWYYSYRDSEYFSIVLVGLTVIGCVVLLFNVIIPQLNSWLSIREEVKATQERIATLKDNINYINNVDRTGLDSQLQIVSKALPPEKDFGAMLDTLTEAAVTSGVSLNDYSFQVGNVASSSGIIADNRYKDIASIRITLIVVGQVENVKRFIRNIAQSVPVSEVVNIDGSGQNISVSIQFYQKSFPNVVINDTKPLAALSGEKLVLIQKLSSWKKASPVIHNSRPQTGSGSAMPLF